MQAHMKAQLSVRMLAWESVVSMQCRVSVSSRPCTRCITLAGAARRSKRGDGCPAGGWHLRQRARQHAAQPGRYLRSWGALPCSTLHCITELQTLLGSTVDCAASQAVHAEQAPALALERARRHLCVLCYMAASALTYTGMTAEPMYQSFTALLPWEVSAHLRRDLRSDAGEWHVHERCRGSQQVHVEQLTQAREDEGRWAQRPGWHERVS